MDKTYLVRRSATSGAAPTSATGTTGELIANTFDGRLWLRGNNGTDTIYEITRPLPSTIAQGGATSGQYLRWNGTAWAAYTIPAVAPSDITAGGAFTGMYLKWSGTAWTPTYFVPAPWELDTTYASVGQFIGFDGESYFPLQVAPSNLAQQSAAVGQCIAWSAIGWVPAARFTQTVNVQTFDASGTWTKPAGAVTTTIQLCGGGAGGGNASSTTGGIGGASGDNYLRTVASSTLGATESVTIGAGGTGGTNIGGTVVAATFGNATTFNKFFALRGGQGSSVAASIRGNMPLAGNNYWGSGGSAGAAGYINPEGSGGGGGGSNGVNASGAAGGSSSATRPITYASLGVAAQGGGAAAGATGNPGAVGSNGVTDANGFGSGAGGGGAAATGFANALGGNGGNGIRGSGGGGGGRGGSTSIGGASGGAGGNGFAIITTVCYT